MKIVGLVEDTWNIDMVRWLQLKIVYSRLI